MTAHDREEAVRVLADAIHGEDCTCPFTADEADVRLAARILDTIPTNPERAAALARYLAPDAGLRAALLVLHPEGPHRSDLCDAGTCPTRRLARALDAARPEPAALDWPTLANVIREVDGNHDLGAGELAERILSHPKVRRPEPAALRAKGDGYEVQTWVGHQPSGVVVLKGHPQLGGRYCTTDGGDWPCAAVRAALSAVSGGVERPDPAKAVALAVYAGVDGQAEPDDDGAALRAIATWMDAIDDATDAELERAGKDHRAGRSMQARLRAIADRLAAPSAGGTLDVERLVRAYEACDTALREFLTRVAAEYARLSSETEDVK